MQHISFPNGISLEHDVPRTISHELTLRMNSKLRVHWDIFAQRVVERFCRDASSCRNTRLHCKHKLSEVKHATGLGNPPAPPRSHKQMTKHEKALCYCGGFRWTAQSTMSAIKSTPTTDREGASALASYTTRWRQKRRRRRGRSKRSKRPVKGGVGEDRGGSVLRCLQNRLP